LSFGSCNTSNSTAPPATLGQSTTDPQLGLAIAPVIAPAPFEATKADKP
jgi:hypothetical protein